MPRNIRPNKSISTTQPATKRSKDSPASMWRVFYSSLKNPVIGAWRKNVFNKIFITLIALVMLSAATMQGIGRWYIWQNRHEPTVMGATFISNYASYLGVEPKDTLHAIIYDLGAKHLRLVSYWDATEKSPGVYDFSDLDWQFKMAEEAGVKVSLALGLRQPRWPECHMPEWASKKPKSEWYPALKVFIEKVIDRYHTSPTLESYQLENEFFLTVFGICTDFDRNRLIDEAALVSRLDPHHKLIISRSNNGVGFPVNKPTPDEFGVSVYKRVWDKTVTKRYFEYPFPASFYGFLAGGGKIISGKDMIIHELQAEAWTPDGYEIKTAPISELYKSMNPERLKDRFEYGRATGMKTIDLWGVEWWYQMKVNRGAPELWETAKAEYSRIEMSNSKR